MVANLGQLHQGETPCRHSRKTVRQPTKKGSEATTAVPSEARGALAPCRVAGRAAHPPQEPDKGNGHETRPQP